MARLPDVLMDQGTDLDRIKAFSDGVFSIAITLLVLGLQVPKQDPDHPHPLIQDLGRLALPLTSYVISFALVGLYWVIHCRIFRHLKAHSRGLAVYNLVFLFFISLVPFTTPLVHQYRRDELAWGIYFGNLAFVAFGAAFVWYQAMKRGFLREDTPGLLSSYILTRALIPGFVFTLTTIMVFINFQVAAFTPILAALLFRVVNRHYAKLAEIGPAPLPEDHPQSPSV